MLDKFFTLKITHIIKKPRNYTTETKNGLSCSIHWIYLYLVNSAIGFPNTYPLDSNLSGRQRYPLLNNWGHKCFQQVP